jgi:hypothetical protein
MNARKRSIMHHRTPLYGFKRIATLIVVAKDGTIEAVRFRKLKLAREAAFHLNEGGNCRCAFALMR